MYFMGKCFQTVSYFCEELHLRSYMIGNVISMDFGKTPILVLLSKPSMYTSR